MVSDAFINSKRSTDRKKKLLDIDRITLDTFDAYAILTSNGESKPIIEDFLDEIALFIRRQIPDILKTKKPKWGSLKVQLPPITTVPKKIKPLKKAK